jgi:hypothetical protein
MLDTLKNQLVRFLSIVGGFSSPEDIARAKQRSGVQTPKRTDAGVDEAGKTDSTV